MWAWRGRGLAAGRVKEASAKKINIFFIFLFNNSRANRGGMTWAWRGVAWQGRGVRVAEIFFSNFFLNFFFLI